MLNFFIAIIFAILLSGCVSTIDEHAVLNQAGLDFQSKNYSQAFDRLFPLAKKGNPQAQYTVGYMYYYGLGVHENRKQAQFWIHQSADNGNPNAQKALNIVERAHAGL